MELRSHTRRLQTLCSGEEPSSVREIELSGNTLPKDLRDALRATGYFESTSSVVRIQVEEGGHVILNGVVPSFYLKQRAQVAVMSVNGVKSLQNNLIVSQADGRSR